MSASEEPLTPSASGLPTADSATRAGVELSELRRAWQALLEGVTLADHDNLFDAGAHSLLVVRFVKDLRERGITTLSVTDVYDRPTLAGIASVLRGDVRSSKASAQHRSRSATQGIAIVGMATRTAGAVDLEGFWANLVANEEGLRRFTPDEVDALIPESVRSRPNFVPVRGVLDDVARFDAGFFGISAREATMLDPQQRVMLELSWSAMEHAAIDPSRTDERIGVYVGVGNNTYAPLLQQEQPELIAQFGEFASTLTSEKDYVATRIAHRLDLKGPAVSVHTACSTGLVVVAQAWHALASGQCDVALAGGATVIVPQQGGYLTIEGAMESGDGHCRPFDADANGTVFTSGAGVVVLKRVEDAIAAGDTIYAVIRGVGVNNDGGEKASFTAPSVSGQAGAIRMALEHAGVDPRRIGYVEAHGTGTPLGDPIEIAALTRAWRQDTQDTQYCVIGSLKGNLGHTIAAAGVLGLIKAALSLHREVVPATLNFRSPNPQIDFANTPFYVSPANRPWPRHERPRLAAVSSFGVGGTNAHAVLEEAPVRTVEAMGSRQDATLLLLSAATPEAVAKRAADLAVHLQAHPSTSLADVAVTLLDGRKPMAYRLAVVARDPSAAVRALGVARASVKASSGQRLVFLFPGQGSQHPGMARGLYEEAPAFRAALNRCFETAARCGVPDLRSWLIDAAPNDEVAAEQLAETRHAQPALFSVCYAAAAWLESLGLQPDAMIGHSIGEYAAACRAGVLTLDDAMAAVIARGEAMFRQPRGAMLAVKAGVEALTPLMPQGVEIAGCNAPALTVVAGSLPSIEAFATSLQQQELASTRLRVSHAFHSAAMEPAAQAVEAALHRAHLRAPSTTVYSCISGEPLQASQAMDPRYWARQMRAPVQFSRAVRAELARAEPVVFLEVGPGQALTALIKQHRSDRGDVPTIVPLMGPAHTPGDTVNHALQALGALWAQGIGFAVPRPEHGCRIGLPTYPFGGAHHWFKPRHASSVKATSLSPPAATVHQPPGITHSVESSPVMSRIPVLQQELKRVFSDVSGIPVETMTLESTFVDQGLDSLSMTQAALELERVFGVKLRLRRLLDELDSIEKLSQFLHGELPADRFAPPTEPVPVAAVSPQATPAQAVFQPSTMPLPQVAAPVFTPMSVATSTAPPPQAGGALHHLLQQQMQLMSQQLSLLSGHSVVATAVGPAVAPTDGAAAVRQAPPAVAVPQDVDPIRSVSQPHAITTESGEGSQPSIKALVEKPFGASARITLERQEMTPDQQQWLQSFIKRYNERSGTSKSFSQEHRKRMADPRVVTGFNPLWKDLVYPIVVDRSKGAKMWDVDGNEYIDLLSCFGANLLGYQPNDIVKAMVDQLEAGIEVGPQHPMAAEVAALMSEFTGMERIAFCNTGSEAVMGAMRIARTVTGRKTIAIFNNSYHGIFDEVIVRGTKQLRSLSAAPGILANSVENILVLDYASDEALETLRSRGHELAAIMIEPVQNKYPTLQPREFVKELRRIADQKGCALIFDEVVTGFRLAPGGAQEFYGVRADIASYGKIVGGGLPFAAIAGNSRWLDALDGGHWQYGDDSYPEAGVTYFAGTYVRHPLALAAARATLLHLKRGGAALYATLNGHTQNLVDRLNTAFAMRGAPVKAVHCASLWRLTWDDNNRFIGLFYYLARYHGLHLYEQFGHFVTEAMGEDEINRIFEVFTSALDELMALGFIAPKAGTPPSGGGGGRAKREVAPLTPGQAERWLAASFDANAQRALNESFCISLKGPVNVPALKLALQDVLTRHDAFRVAFDLDQPQQKLGPAVAFPVVDVDLTDRPDADEALDAFCTDANRRHFTLDQAPLAAVHLLTLSDDRIAVHMVGSHLVYDGWASSVMNQELALAYRARSEGKLAAFKPAESPFDFAVAEQERMAGAQGQQSLNYWTTVLTDPPAPLALGDRQPPLTRQFTADTVRSRIDGDLLLRLRKRARESGTTMYQFLLGAVTLMLFHRSEQAEFVVGVPYASQGLDRHGPLMADGVLDLPLRLACEPQQRVDSVLADVRSRLLDGLEHPLVTMAAVARALGIRGQGHRPSLTGVFFNLNPRIDISGYEPLEMELREGRKGGILSELFFNFSEKPDALTLDLHHSTEFFSPARAQALVDDLHAVCSVLADSTKVSVQELRRAVATSGDQAALPRVQPDERVRAWNEATAAALEAKPRVEKRISEQALRTPSATAVIVNGKSLTYAELERRANKFANVLRDRGVGANQLVGLCLGRGLDLLPALLGVLKTGAAYVPLDPSFPKDRLQYMAQDAKVALVITESAHADRASVDRQHQLRIDDDAALITAASEAPVAAPSDLPAHAPAYVIYTSGSTGKPKGVIVPQRAVCNFLASMRHEPGLSADDRLLAVTTLSFDIAVLELLLPLSIGACVVLAQREDTVDGEALARLIDQQRVSVMQATPTTWHLLLDMGWRAPTGFRALCGGEALPPSLASRLLAQGLELWNMYGPTETTVWSTVARVLDAEQKISIGQPIENTQVWILNEAMQACAVGEEGEIVIGGLGVANGYFERPELTSERFVRDPFSMDASARLYRTGDLGRWLADGTLEHLGRLDFQVKVRGYRIELGEIEARLALQPNVGRAVVVAREDAPGDVRLVAYVVPQAGKALETSGFRDALRRDLPEYMLPQHVVQLDALPLLPNGKIDRKSLPAPSHAAKASSERKPVGVADALAVQLAALMAEVLKRPSVKVDDDFFDLGGHSLLAARLASRIHAQLGQRVQLRTLFESPTAEKLAKALHHPAAIGTPAVDSANSIPALADQSVAPLTLMQERVRFVEELHPGRSVYHMPMAVRLEGVVDVPKLELALREVVRRQSVLRTAVAASVNGAAFEQQVIDAPRIKLLCEDLSGLAGAVQDAELKRRMHALRDTRFDLDQAPLFRARVFKLAEDAFVFFFMPHHLVWDGASNELLCKEMAAIYGAMVDGEARALPALPVSYGDYAAWQAAWMQSDECRKQVAYWRQLFARAPLPNAMRVGRSRRQGVGAESQVHKFVLDRDTTERLRAVARGADATLSMLSMAIYASLMTQELGADTVVIGVPARARSLPQIESVMGFFSNTLPIPVTVDESLPMSAWLRLIRSDLIDAMSHQDVPFERLIEEPEIAARAQSGGLYQTLFSFEDARGLPSHWGSAKASDLNVDYRGVTQDLGLWLTEIGEGLEGHLVHNPETQPLDVVVQLRGRFLAMVDRVIADPDLAVGALLRSLPARVVPADKLAMDAEDAVQPGVTVLPSAASKLIAAEPEAELAGIWAALLQLDVKMIRAEDNFFDLGGDSMLAMRAIDQSSKVQGFRVEPRRYVFESLGQLARRPGAAANEDVAPSQRRSSAQGLVGRVLGGFGLQSRERLR